MAPTGRADEARQQALTLLDAGPVAMTRAHRPGHITASTLVVDTDGRILLCLHGRMGRWMQLGGHCEPGDATVAAAALREATEESGLAGLRLLDEPIDVDVHPVRCKPADGGPATDSVHYDIRFVAISPSGATEQVSDESAALGWFTSDALPNPLADGVTQQIGPALARLRLGRA
ncbi:MAG TPA: NUDIX domain-containing protein [Actinoplanes sp.]|nr:NUDIX domain-containing protein [Actinoplanes sp.]